MTPEETAAAARWPLSIAEKVVGGCVILLLGWMATSVQTTATKVAVIEAQLRTLSASPYSAADAAKDRDLVNERIAALTRRVDTLETVRQ